MKKRFVPRAAVKKVDVSKFMTDTHVTVSDHLSFFRMNPGDTFWFRDGRERVFMSHKFINALSYKDARVRVTGKFVDDGSDFDIFLPFDWAVFPFTVKRRADFIVSLNGKEYGAISYLNGYSGRLDELIKLTGADSLFIMRDDAGQLRFIEAKNLESVREV